MGLLSAIKALFENDVPEELTPNEVAEIEALEQQLNKENNTNLSDLLAEKREKVSPKAKTPTVKTKQTQQRTGKER